ncbi:LysR family transcriptional regulator [Xylophilus sp. GOD-11R]|uniref:LysR family transcriptional regulator n=1 Tax=Xylophilus sp. GOD-11R TaxID=3089814 RepID=UPI00298D1A67|nr:LysR family transcriptional regulator [Xylophilus sp. GOD-11R]WPB56610.1 LysR family transcriptional regulator [Xylophilus sp. GOD-11R]
MDRLQSMKVFQRVADEGSFAAAARALDLSPAAVTRFVIDLEKHLGTRLLQRTTRRIALTEAGDHYLTRLRGILAELDEAESAASAHSRELRGVLHMIATPVLASYFLAPRVAAWTLRHPKVVLDITVDAIPQTRVEEFDLTFLIEDENFDANLVARPLMHGEWLFCASPGYLARAGIPLVPHDLREHHFLRQQRRGGGRRIRLLPASGAGEAIDVDANVTLQSMHSDVLHRAALDGAGIALLSRLLTTNQIASGELVHVLPDWVGGRYTLYGAMPSRQLVPARSHAFLEFLREPFVPVRESPGRFTV